VSEGEPSRPSTSSAKALGTDDALTAETPPWRHLPSSFVFGDQDRNIPVALHRFLAKRAGAQASHELAGASHAISVPEPEAVTAAILDATTAL
jgi:pimeloyl-ACP methyl ester carboxylesterase